MSTFAMWNYHRINKKKEEQCKREGITADRTDEFKDMCDDSPLFRSVTLAVPSISKHSQYLYHAGISSDVILLYNKFYLIRYICSISFP